MDDHEHIVGNVYYQIGIAPIGPDGGAQPLVSTWRFDGVFRQNFTSSLCDTPYHFMRFTRLPKDSFESNAREPERINIPSRAQAHMSMLAWEEFVETVADVARYEYPDPDEERAG